MEMVINEVSKEQVIADFKTMVADAEALLRATASHGGDELAEVRAKVEESIRAVKVRLADEQAALMAKTKEAAKATDVYVHDHPWAAVGVAAGVGLVVGLLSNRR
jgi:ElaB/YqjD/DUF883 family membrane-anchored ribosome-binding protein